MNESIGSRIIILGCSGSGKSFFARKLHECTGLPLFHLDNVWWKADRTHIGSDEFDRQLEEILKGKSWIIDGDYSRTYEQRIRACDTLVFLDYGEEECLRGITERVGRKRDDIPWVEDHLDPQLLKMVQNYRSENRPVIYALLEKYPQKRQIIFYTRQEADAWLSDICSR